MNNNTPAIIRTLIVYAICVPLAIWLGFLLTDNWDRTTFISAGGLALLLAMPILLRWHHLLLVFSWNFGLMIFFLQGQPMVVIPMIALSFTIAILQRALNRDMHFISVPALTWPMLFIVVVAYFTGKMTGGFGLHSFGGDVMGGKKYVLIFVAVMGYFALTSQRIPPKRAWLYLALFFLPGCVSVIGDLAGFLPSSFDFIFLFFPANMETPGAEDVGLRLSGVSHLAGALNYLVLLRYGLRGIFLSGRPWRLFIFLVCIFFSMAGGYRNVLVGDFLLLGILFFLEGLHRTKLLPVVIMGGILAFVIIIPLAGKLPYGFQRTLSFLPVNVSAAARLDAQNSTEWRIQMWKAVLPEVPDHLLLGKGYSLSQSDYTDITGHFQTIDAAAWTAAIAGDYHSGPLSLILPLGIWGIIAYFWMVIGGGRVLYNNYRYGDPALRTINTVLLAMFLSQVVFFIFIFGAFSTDMLSYAGLLGINVSLNGGMCRRPATAPAKAPDKVMAPAPSRPRFQPFYPR